MDKQTLQAILLLVYKILQRCKDIDEARQSISELLSDEIEETMK